MLPMRKNSQYLVVKCSKLLQHFRMHDNAKTVLNRGPRADWPHSCYTQDIALNLELPSYFQPPGELYRHDLNKCLFGRIGHKSLINALCHRHCQMQKNQDQKSRGSKARAKINKQTNGRTWPSVLPFLPMLSVKYYARSHKLFWPGLFKYWRLFA